MKLKHLLYSICLLMSMTQFAFAQKKEKIKGSKIVTTIQKELGAFSALEVGDNLEIILEKGEKNAVTIESDDNLQEVISFDFREKTLFISTSKEIQGAKKLSIKLIYTNELQLITTKEEAQITATQELILNQLTLKTLDKSKVNLALNTKNFVLQSNDKSKIEIRITSEECKIESSKNATLKAILNTSSLICDLYQKSESTLEGNATQAVIRMDNDSELKAQNLILKNATCTTEGNSRCVLNAELTLSIEASGKSEIKLYGNPKIDLKTFANEAQIMKKEKTK